MDLCLQVYGQISMLTSRLYINIGIVYEDTKNYVKAFEYFRKWALTSEEVLGPTHPKTLRAKGVLNEPRYKRIADRLKEQDNQVSEEGNLDLINEINQEIDEHETDFMYASDNEDDNITNDAIMFDDFHGNVDDLIENIISMHMQHRGQESATNEQEISEDLAEFDDQEIQEILDDNQLSFHDDDDDDNDDDDDDDIVIHRTENNLDDTNNT